MSPAAAVSTVTWALESVSGFPEWSAAAVVRVTVLAAGAAVCCRPLRFGVEPLRLKPAGFAMWRTTAPPPVTVTLYVYGEPSSEPRWFAIAWRLASWVTLVSSARSRLPTPSVQTSPECTSPVSVRSTLE